MTTAEFLNHVRRVMDRVSGEWEFTEPPSGCPSSRLDRAYLVYVSRNGTNQVLCVWWDRERGYDVRDMKPREALNEWYTGLLNNYTRLDDGTLVPPPPERTNETA